MKAGHGFDCFCSQCVDDELLICDQCEIKHGGETHAQMIERMLGEEGLSDGLGWLCPKCLIGELNEGPIWSYSCPKCVFFCDFDGLIEAIQIFNCEDMD